MADDAAAVGDVESAPDDNVRARDGEEAKTILSVRAVQINRIELPRKQFRKLG